MNKVFFIRHNRLSGKFSDYNTLSFSDLRNLGLNIGSYSITQERSLDFHTCIEENTICFTSLQKRTIETANILGCFDIKSREYLGEIYFDLAKLMTEEEYNTGGGLPSVRVALWKSFFARKEGVESPESVMERIQLLLAEVKNCSEENILMVTHGFFLQIVRCFLINGIDFTKISYSEFQSLKILPVGYLESFEVVV